MSGFAQHIASSRISPKEMAALSVAAEPLPFVSEQGVRIARSNPVAKLEAVAAAASEPTLRQAGTAHLADRTPEGISNAKRALRPLGNTVDQLARFAEGKVTAPAKADTQKALAAARGVFNENNELGARAQQMLDAVATQLSLGDIKDIGRKRGGRG